MRLSDWLQLQQISETEFAKRIGVEPSTVSRLIPRDGKKQIRRPGWSLMLAIQEATDGAVSANDWLHAFAEEQERRCATLALTDSAEAVE